ncbi:cytidylyltransferase domain-containing protein [Ensifer sp. NPDC090286]|uniref:acylneuraminate cytidylyltransferase family protein n=1 Tax=Ensifer sp. NPDC090286 TaxID=3363991 RepID=UPI00383BD218
MKIFAFVFARGGSKGLPGKNIRPIGGVPLLAHSIRAGFEVAAERVFVSTDDPDIAAVARAYNAEVIDRPPELATDTASEWLAWQHAIQYLREQGREFDVFLSLPATAPLRSAEDVRQCLQALDDETDVVVTVSPAARSPYFNMVIREANGSSRVVLGDVGYKRRQDAPEVYDMSTVAYVTRPDFVMRTTGLFQGRVRSVVVPKERAVDIDDAFDFIIAEALFEKCQ